MLFVAAVVAVLAAGAAAGAAAAAAAGGAARNCSCNGGGGGSTFLGVEFAESPPPLVLLLLRLIGLVLPDEGGRVLRPLPLPAERAIGVPPRDEDKDPPLRAVGAGGRGGRLRSRESYRSMSEPTVLPPMRVTPPLDECCVFLFSCGEPRGVCPPDDRAPLLTLPLLPPPLLLPPLLAPLLLLLLLLLVLLLLPRLRLLLPGMRVRDTLPDVDGAGTGLRVRGVTRRESGVVGVEDAEEDEDRDEGVPPPLPLLREDVPRERLLEGFERPARTDDEVDDEEDGVVAAAAWDGVDARGFRTDPRGVALASLLLLLLLLLLKRGVD